MIFGRRRRTPPHLERPGPLVQITLQAKCLACGENWEALIDVQKLRELFIAEIAHSAMGLAMFLLRHDFNQPRPAYMATLPHARCRGPVDDLRANLRAVRGDGNGEPH